MHVVGLGDQGLNQGLGAGPGVRGWVSIRVIGPGIRCYVRVRAQLPPN